VTKRFNCKLQRVALSAIAILVAGGAPLNAYAEEWQVITGAESPDRGTQALAFLTNELWVHTGDSIRWSFHTHERHTVSFLATGQSRPPGFGPTFGVLAGCPGVTPDGSSFDGSECVTSDILLLSTEEDRSANAPTYSVQFPTAGNFKFVCLLHPDMTGVVHVFNASESLPHDQEFYNRQAQRERTLLLGKGSRMQVRSFAAAEDRLQTADLAVGAGEVVTTTGAGSQTISLMRFFRQTIVVRVGDTVEWTSLDPSINHTVSFGTEPVDPRPPSAGVQLTSDGARQAVIASPGDNVNSGFLSAAPQDRPGLPQSLPGVTRFRVTFKSPGTFNYICAIHDDLGMKGRVIVF
jgi:plastocyanin